MDYVQVPLSPRELLLQQLADRAASLALWSGSPVANAFAGLLRPVVEAAAEIANMRDPGHLYMRCVACAVFR